jgi:ribonuclease P protein component
MKASKAQIEMIDRLKRRSDFLRVQGSGKKWVSTTLVLQITENGLEKPRYGLTVSKKTDKSAVVRNRIRRRLRSAALEVLTTRAKPGMDYVLVGRPSGATKDYADIVNDLTWCLKRMELLQ